MRSDPACNPDKNLLMSAEYFFFLVGEQNFFLKRKEIVLNLFIHVNIFSDVFKS